MEIEWRDVKLQGEWMNEKKIERNKKKKCAIKETKIVLF